MVDEAPEMADPTITVRVEYCQLCYCVVLIKGMGGTSSGNFEKHVEYHRNKGELSKEVVNTEIQKNQSPEMEKAEKSPKMAKDKSYGIVTKGRARKGRHRPVTG
jgi:hypothetical protein